MIRILKFFFLCNSKGELTIAISNCRKYGTFTKYVLKITSDWLDMHESYLNADELPKIAAPLLTTMKNLSLRCIRTCLSLSKCADLYVR